MFLAIVDTETTGLDENASMLEIGLIIFDSETMSDIMSLSVLNPSLELEQESSLWSSSRIRKEHLKASKKFNCSFDLMNKIFQYIDQADYVIAHNADFDKRFIKTKTNWLCTQTDFRWKYSNANPSLIRLANDYDVPITGSHRALNDCQLILNVFKKHSKEEFKELLTFALEPNYLVIAECNYENKDKAANLGFKWNIYAKKKWAKILKKSEVKQLQKNHPKELYLIIKEI